MEKLALIYSFHMKTSFTSLVVDICNIKRSACITHMPAFPSFRVDSLGKQGYLTGSIYTNGLTLILNSHLMYMLIGVLFTAANMWKQPSVHQQMEGIQNEVHADYGILLSHKKGKKF